MATNKQPDTDAAPEASAPSDADLAFEAEIVARHPGRRIARYDFPEGVSEARAVYLFELKAKDEVTAAEMADANMSQAERRSMARAMEAERREAIRLSIVGLIDDSGRRHIDQATPLMEIDEWSSKSTAALRAFHSDLNGLPMDELGKALRGARKIGGVLPAKAARAG